MGDSILDPICGMLYAANWDQYDLMTVVHGGKVWFFCNRHCAEAFRERIRHGLPPEGR
ncbi:MAG: hypothetical protein HUU15_10750 [Candidatus Brocadiae bacterium]|nr:hypothetical protein [Candidatus Brocadiia bacterium]